MDSLLALKTEQDGFEVQFEVLSPLQGAVITNPYQQEIAEKLESVNAQLEACNQKVAELNKDIDRLTNHADGLDYTLAVASGILTGLIDSFFVGDWDMAQARAWSSQEINKRIVEFAKKDPEYKDFLKKKKNRENSSLNAIEFLEEKYKLPGDNTWAVKDNFVNMAKKRGFEGCGYEEALRFMNENFPKEGGWAVLENGITKKTHHLDDFCHHPTLVGLVCCIIVQFTGSSIYSNSAGKMVPLPVVVNDYGKFVGNNALSKVFSGIINWFFNVAQTMKNRKGHLLSDMAGSNGSASKGNDGMGLPGPILSTLKELSALPKINETGFAEKIRKAYHNGIGTGKSQLDLGALNTLFDGAKLDLRTEMAIGHELKRQTLPVLINEALVRAVYFIRRFISEVRKCNGIDGINWINIMPFNNRTVIRMLTIATGTFTAVDMADAAIRSGGFNAACLLRVNFVGVGRFAVAIITDVGMGVKRSKLQNEKLAVVGQQLDLMNVKVSYLYASAEYGLSEALEEQSQLWIAAGDTVSTLMEANDYVMQAVEFYRESLREISEDLQRISSYKNAVEQKNPGLTQEMLDTLKWGKN